MSAKFTPGPWFVVPQGSFVADKKVEFDSDGARIGDTPNMCIECASEADAHLIAAAPEMYEALERIYGRLLMSERDGDAHITEEDGAMVEAALRKARGE